MKQPVRLSRLPDLFIPAALLGASALGQPEGAALFSSTMRRKNGETREKAAEDVKSRQIALPSAICRMTHPNSAEQMPFGKLSLILRR